MHSRVVADQPAEVIRITGENDRGTGAERRRGDEGVYRVARLEPVSTR